MGVEVKGRDGRGRDGRGVEGMEGEWRREEEGAMIGFACRNVACGRPKAVLLLGTSSGGEEGRGEGLRSSEGEGWRGR